MGSKTFGNISPYPVSSPQMLAVNWIHYHQLSPEPRGHDLKARYFARHTSVCSEPHCTECTQHCMQWASLHSALKYSLYKRHRKRRGNQKKRPYSPSALSEKSAFLSNFCRCNFCRQNDKSKNPLSTNNVREIQALPKTSFLLCKWVV